MNLNNYTLSMPLPTSSSPSKSANFLSDQFPAGLRVLVVDDDPTCLMILERMLRVCLYEVTKCKKAKVALSLLRENKNGFDIVLSDVHMPDMDGFKLLEHIGLEMDLPVIMMSADDGKNVVMKGVKHGACDYLIKPVRMEALKNIWQHVVRKRKNMWKDLKQFSGLDEGYRQQKASGDVEYSSSANEAKRSRKRKDEEDEADEMGDCSTSKKSRVVWSIELHQQFMAVVNQLGLDQSVPKKIMEMMNVPGLTRENVASHLQKYRLYLRRLSGASQQQSNPNNSFMSSEESIFGASSINGVDLQTQSLANLQAAGLLSFENSKLRFGEGQLQRTSSSKPINFLHGIPTNMEPKHFANLRQSAQSFGSTSTRVNASTAQRSPWLMQMAQSQPRVQMLNENTNFHHSTRFPSSFTRPNGISNGSLGNVIADTSNITMNQDYLQSVSQHLDTLVVDNSLSVNSERIPFQSSEMNPFSEQFSQEDLMSAFLHQHQGVDPVENEFDFDGYSLDNIPVYNRSC